jgi:ribosome assembly protein YihI (activator of Der GTPase)
MLVANTTQVTLRTKLKCTDLYTPAHTQTGMRATKVKVEHMEDRLYIHRNYCLQDLNGKTGLEHLTSLAEIKARPNLDILTEYQKWVDEQSDLVDAIMGMYQLDTSSDVQDEEKEERMSTWVNSLTI